MISNVPLRTDRITFTTNDGADSAAYPYAIRIELHYRGKPERTYIVDEIWAAQTAHDFLHDLKGVVRDTPPSISELEFDY